MTLARDQPLTSCFASLAPRRLLELMVYVGRLRLGGGGRGADEGVPHTKQEERDPSLIVREVGGQPEGVGKGGRDEPVDGEQRHAALSEEECATCSEPEVDEVVRDGAEEQTARDRTRHHHDPGVPGENLHFHVEHG